MSDAYGNIIPRRWVLPERAAKYEQQIFVNWLQMEVPDQPPKPVLHDLKGWRNREVFYFIRYKWPDWTAGINP